VTVSEPTFHLANQMAINMQKRQIDMIQLYIDFQYQLDRWIKLCKTLHIWPGYSRHQGLIDIYA
jgi:hypothetical protein